MTLATTLNRILELEITLSKNGGIPLCKFDWQQIGANNAAQKPQLYENEIHIWFFSLTGDAADLAAGKAILSDRERTRAERFQFDLHRNRFILSHARLRELISHYGGVSASQLELQSDELGKPFLANKIDGRQLSFNHSDSQDYSLAAFAWDCELGIDFEYLSRPIKHVGKIMQHHFTPAEIQTVHELSNNQLEDAFLTVWTSKEAFGKAEGVGIRYAMGAHDVTDNLKTPVRMIKALASSKRELWCASSFALPIDAVATVVYDAKNYLPIKGLSLA